MTPVMGSNLAESTQGASCGISGATASKRSACRRSASARSADGRTMSTDSVWPSCGNTIARYPRYIAPSGTQLTGTSAPGRARYMRAT